LAAIPHTFFFRCVDADAKLGLPGRNTEYLSFASGYAQSIVPAAAILRQCPEGLRPIVAKAVTLPNKYFIRKTAQFLEPEIRSRLAEIDRRSNDPEKKAADAEPNDFLQWLIKYAQERLPPSELSPHIIAGRMLALNFAAIHTSTFTITNIIFDLVSSDPSLDYVGQLREEAATVLAEEGGIWTKRGLSKMHKIDSAIRESLRIRSFLSAGLVRKVVAPNGVTTPDGIHCPKGSNVGIVAMGVHNDNAIYPEAAQFQPFRYVDAREAIAANVETGKFGTEEIIKKANYATVSTSTDFLAFGHGRQACPGRFFAVNELKLLLAYMVLNYDIEPLEKRPDGKWIGQVSLPDMKAKIKIRRRNVN
jgi:cytochrome P450